MKLKLIFESGKRSVLIEPSSDDDRRMLKALFKFNDQVRLRIDDSIYFGMVDGVELVINEGVDN